MRREEWDRTNEVLVAATEAVLGDAGAAITYCGRSELPRGAMKLAVIGFAGEHMRGMLAVSLAEALLVRTCPPKAKKDDWLCELSNLLLGRFKAELLRLGITVHLSTPMLVDGSDVSLDTYAVSTIVHRFTAPGGDALYVVLDAIADTATRVRPSEVALAAEGTVVMFEGGDHA